MPQVDSNLTRFVSKYDMKYLERVPGPRKMMIIEDELDLSSL